MNGAGRLSTHVMEGNTGAPTPANGMRRWWWRYSSSAQRASPPPRFLLVILLSAQILFLAIVRLGPSAILWGEQGTGSSAQASSQLFSTLSRNPVFVSGISMKSQEFPEKENKLSSESSPALTEETDNVGRFKKRKGSDNAPEAVSHMKETGNVAHVDQREGLVDEVVSDKEKTSNVANVKQEVGDGVPQEVENRRRAKERYDELLPSVDDNILTDTAIKETSPSVAEDNLGGDNMNELTLESSTLAIAMEGEQKGSSSANGTGYTKKTVSSTRKARKSRKVGGKRDRNAVKIKQVVTKTDVQTEPAKEKTGESTHLFDKEGPGGVSEKERQVPLAEKVEEASVDVSLENLLSKQEDQPVATEEAKESATSMATIAEEEGRNQGLRITTSEEQGFVKEDKAPVEQKVHKEPENQATTQEVKPVATEEAKKSTTSMAAITEEEQHIEGLQTTASEKGSIKEDKALVEQKLHEETSSSECSYGYVYVYELPSAFNRDVVSNCTALNPWYDVCSRLSNGGLGESLGEASPLGQVGSWYVSDQFTAELVFHNRILQHGCLTDNMDVASAFYVPFYAGLDVGRYLVAGASVESRDRLSTQFVDWLIEQPAWKKSGGLGHFMTVGRNTWDFRRSRDEEWGSGFFNKPAIQNITKLLLERNPWDAREMAVPYLTNFHPQSDADLVAWQNHLRVLKRNNLFSFAGAPRDNFPDDFRRILFEQCKQVEQCRFLDCSNGTCDDNQRTLEFFMDSTFCLQPRGDSFTRRSTFDCLLAGSIPVFFWRRSAYMQYEWHLPTDEGSYSVFISRQDVRNGTKIEDILKAFAPEKVQSMQEAVIQLIPRVVYAVSGFALKGKDAFDVAVEGVMKSLKGPRVGSYR